MHASGVAEAPIVDADGRYLGVVSRAALERRGPSKESPTGVPVDLTPSPVYQDVRLNVVLDVLTSLPQTWATVVDPDLRVVGTIALSDIVRNYRRTTQTYLRRLAETAGTTGLAELVIAANSRLVGHSLRSASIPRGALITTIERGTEVIRPTGDTVFHAGDRLTVLGAENEIDQLTRVSNSPPGHRDQA